MNQETYQPAQGPNYGRVIIPEDRPLAVPAEGFQDHLKSLAITELYQLADQVAGAPDPGHKRYQAIREELTSRGGECYLLKRPATA